jgi:outer membrane receptor protein involved in Fe transport
MAFQINGLSEMRLLYMRHPSPRGPNRPPTLPVMTGPLRTLLVAAFACGAPAIGVAQSPPATPPAPPPPPVSEIIVTGERPTVETAIDRKIYSLSRELQATAGTAADVLRNIPSISVDLEGNPSLRGDDSVQILIDGRLAPQYNNANRGAALQQLGADNIERIEVITNPPANFKRDGSAGIINIVTRRSTGTRSASAQASLGSRGRYNLAGSGGARLGNLNLRGTAGVRHDLRVREFDGRRIERDAATSAVVTDRELRGAGEDDRLSKSITLAADYDLTSVDRISAEGQFYRRDADSWLRERSVVLAADGSAASDYDRERNSREREYSSDALLSFHHAGEQEGDGLTVRAQRSDSSETRPLRYLTNYRVPAPAATFHIQGFRQDESISEISADYVTTRAGGRKWSLGYDLHRDDNLYDYRLTVPVPVGGAAVPDPNYTNVFQYEQTIHALYASYEQPFTLWTLLAGLRFEQADLRTHQVTDGQRDGQSYLRAYPSLHLSRKLGERQTLMFSYGRRVSRAEGADLNPYLVQQDEFTLRRGNPYLLPREIDSFEAGWSHESGQTSLGATLYARRSRNNFTFVTTPVSPAVALITPENLGTSDSGGLELTASGRLAPGLDYNLSGNVYYNDVDARNLGIAGTRSAYSHDAKAALTWRPGSKDTVQVNIGSAGKRLTAQGYRRGNTAMDLGYRHRFRPNFSVTVTLSDVFASRRFGNVLDTPELTGSETVTQASRVVFVGVSWTMAGAKQPPAEDFEYE